MAENINSIMAAVLGLIVGSFLNALIYRLPRRISFALQRSICPKCQTQLKWYHNIPLLSYIFLGGKCASCRQAISLRYPFVEALNMAAYLAAYLYFGLTWQCAIHCFLASSLIVIFFVDLDFQIIPDAITLPGIVLGLAVSWLPGGIGILPAIIGLLVGGGSLYLVAILGDFLFKKESMGGGDIKMAAMLGAFLGWQRILLVFIGSALIGLVVSMIIMIFSKSLRQSRVIPFGPFIAAAAVVSIVYGDQIIGFYVTHFLGTR